MKAIILAAGRGSRMGKETEHKPKCLVKVEGKTLIQHQIDALTQAGIDDIALVTGYKNELLKDYGSCHFYNDQWSKTNMVASLLCARSWLEHEDCIISYSDIFYSAEIINDLAKNPAPFIIAYDPNWLKLWSKRFTNPLTDAESFSFNLNFYLTDIGRKNPRLEEVNGQYMGLLKINKGILIKFITELEVDTTHIDMTSLLSQIIKKHDILCIPNKDTWGEVDNMNDLLLYNK